MAVINTNTLSLMTQNNLNKSQSSLGTAIERLSSGLRINSAKDDAAGQAISNRFTSNINGLTVAARNANDGISLAQTAEGALSEINNNLQRVRDLTVQAQNSSNSASDIDSIQSEVNQRMEEIDRVTKQTDFNGIKVLNNRGTDSQNYDFQIGAKDNEKISIAINSSDGWNLASAGATGTTLNSNQATADAAKGVYDAAYASAQATAKTDAYSNALGAQLKGAQAEWDAYGAATGATTKAAALATFQAKAGITATALAGQTLTAVGALFTANTPAATKAATDALATGTKAVTFTAATKTSVQATADKAVAAAGDSASKEAGLKAVNAAATSTNGYADRVVNGELRTVAATGFDVLSGTVDATGTTDGSPLADIDAAIKSVDTQRSILGASQNRFESTITNLNNTVNNLSDARSRIQDSDYATEVSNMSRAQILQQAGSSVLAQANQVPQTMLSLLR